MEKDHFKAVLQNYFNCTEEEAIEVLSLKKNFPYSQLLHALSARVSQDHSLTGHQQELQLAAVYATDRSVLKEVMTINNLIDKKELKPARSREKVVSRSPEVKAGIGVSLADEVMDDLDKLQHLRHNFELMFMDGGHTPMSEHSENETHPEVTHATESALNFARHRQSSKSKKERIIEAAKAVEASKAAEIQPEEPGLKSIKKKRNPGEAIIEEIVSSNEPIEPESEKQKEQLEIIEQFIKTQPSISNAKDKAAADAAIDLATIQTGEFSDHIVSETLVEILLKQGKKDKAIEVLKKLIWKFPQKKAYFAAQIEELKK